MSRNARVMLLVVGLLAGACGHRSADSVGQAGAPAEETTGGESTTTVGAAAPETTATSGAAASGDVDVVQRIPGKPGTPGTGGSGTQGGPSSAAGGSGGPATGGESLPGGSSAGVTGDAIKIGGVFPLSGGISALGRPAEQAARAYFRSVNDAGGVGGRRIEFIAEDDGGDPNRTRAAAEKLVEKDGIFVMGPSFTPFSPDLVGFLEGKGVPFIGFDGVNVEGFASSTTVTLGASIAPHARTLVPYWVEKTKTTKIGVVYLDVPPAVSYLNDTRNVICPKLGCEVIEAQPVQFNTTDYTSILLRMRTAGVEGIFIVTDPGSAVKLLLQARQQNYKPSPGGYLGQHGIYLDLVAKSCGSFCDGILAPTSLFPPQVKNSATEEMRATVGRYYSDVDYGYFTELGYVSAKLLVDVLRSAGTPDRAKVLAVAQGLTAYDTGGFTNPAKPLDLTPGREHPRDMILMRMEGGAWKQETDWLSPRAF